MHFNTAGSDKVNLTNVSKKCQWVLRAIACNGKTQARFLPEFNTY
jgi:hypothetical protein